MNENKTTREERVEICNRIIQEIASRSRRLLCNKGDGTVGRFVHDKKLWYIDHYTKVRVYPYTRWGRPYNFTPGGTMWGLINDMRQFIITGEMSNAVHGYGGLYCPHWGYPQEDMKAIQDLAIELGYMGNHKEDYERHKARQSA